jgi:CheY-like chemotaxis protein
MDDQSRNYLRAMATGKDSMLRQVAEELVSAMWAAIAQRSFPVSPGSESMSIGSPAARQRALRLLLIEDDPIDLAWITELIHEKCPGTEVVHSDSLPQAFSVLAQQMPDAVFVSVRPDGRTESIENCRELVSRANGRPVVALVNLAEMDHAADVRETGVRFIYCKHPILRMAHIRKLEVRQTYEAQIASKSHGGPLRPPRYHSREPQRHCTRNPLTASGRPRPVQEDGPCGPPSTGGSDADGAR